MDRRDIKVGRPRTGVRPARRGVFGPAVVILAALPMYPTGAEPSVVSPPPRPTAAMERLGEWYAGVRVQAGRLGEPVLVFGVPMTRGRTPTEAAAAWLRRHSDVFGVTADELQLVRTDVVGTGRLLAFSYRQYMDGLPVEDSIVRIVVGARSDRVVLAGARVVSRLGHGLPKVGMPADEAAVHAATMARERSLEVQSAPELVVLVPKSAGGPALVRAWRITAGSRTPGRGALTYYIDAADGRLVETRDRTSEVVVGGLVHGMATPGTAPLFPASETTDTLLPGVRVRVSDGGTAYSEANGSFAVDGPRKTYLDVVADLAGEWIRVRNGAGADLSLQRTVIRFLPEAEFFFNASPTEFATAQLNAMVHVFAARAFFRDRQPDLLELDVPLTAVVNLGGGRACSAIFNSVTQSLEFTASTPQCPNAAYSTIVTHEYGHGVLNRLGFGDPQGAFGEGFADSLSVLTFGDPVIGRDFRGTGVPVRDIELADRQYPCAGEFHACGQVLAGVWWDLWGRIRSAVGDEAGADEVRQLFTDWARISLGGSEPDAAHPATAVEMLTAADDDDDLSTLSPRWREICAALNDHNIRCPISDCNGNGWDDRTDVQTGRSGDCTGNGLPDECERDCDGNGTADSCDVAEGRLADEDGNGAPDACQRTLAVPSANFPTIQAGIDAASPGDTVLVAPGTYRGPGNRDLDYRGKAIAVVCGAAAACTIDGERMARVFRFHTGEDERSVLDGFSIINGEPTEVDGDGGGVLCATASPTIRNCRLINNRARLGAGIFCHMAAPTIENCVVAGNIAREGAGGIGVLGGAPTIVHCTVVGNRARGETSGIYQGDAASRPIVRNCLVWTDDRGTAGDLVLNPALASVTYTLSRRAFPGVGNLVANPVFVGTAVGDFRLTPTSPGVNRGDPADSGLDDTDALGVRRPWGCRVDLGAFETQAAQLFGDFDNSARLDLSDVAALQLCFQPERSNPAWRDACLCVFDLDGDGSVGPADVPGFVTALDGP